MLDEKEYLTLADKTFRKIADAFENIDGEDADLEPKGDVLTIRYKDGSRMVINTQRPTRQIWVSAQSRGWHFTYDSNASKWLDDKGSGTELFELIAKTTLDATGLKL